jgi:osmotically-inducible protein OsmY
VWTSWRTPDEAPPPGDPETGRLYGARGGRIRGAHAPLSEEGSMTMDSEIARDVEEELRKAPQIDATDVAVTVKDGVVTLTGFVHSYNEKVEAERIAKSVTGVTGVANDIEVHLRDVDARPDPEIARDVVAALRHELPVSWERIKVTVANGHVRLGGNVEWRYERENAERAIRRIHGVTGIGNLIRIQPTAPAVEVKRRIEEALLRSAEIDANRIKVEADGGNVVLKCTVRSWAEREEAERAAWLAPGVAKVDNQIVVRL